MSQNQSAEKQDFIIKALPLFFVAMSFKISTRSDLIAGAVVFVGIGLVMGTTAFFGRDWVSNVRWNGVSYSTTPCTLRFGARSER